MIVIAVEVRHNVILHLVIAVAGQLWLSERGGVHDSAGAAAKPSGAARDRHIRRGRERRGGLQGVHPGGVAVQRQGRQNFQAKVCLQVSRVAWPGWPWLPLPSPAWP